MAASLGTVLAIATVDQQRAVPRDVWLEPGNVARAEGSLPYVW